MQSKSTKKSLIASGLALLTCCALLAGTTFAWFTDSVVNKNNKIQAGTLDVSLAEWDGAQGGYVEVGQDPIFNYDKWEPGYTDIAAVKIGNEGSLALKYQLDIVAAGATDLAEVIDVYYYGGGAVTQPSDLPDSFAALEADGNYQNLGTLAGLLEDNANGVAHGHLLAGEADFAIIALHMQETAGNEYQGASLGETFDIVLHATQYTYETDAFDDQYDADAEYYDTFAGSSSELAEALTQAQPGEIIALDQKVAYDGEFTIPAGVTLDANGAEIKNSNGTAIKITANDVTIQDAVITDANGQFGIEVGTTAQNTVIEGCTITGTKSSFGHQYLAECRECHHPELYH